MFSKNFVEMNFGKTSIFRKHRLRKVVNSIKVQTSCRWRNSFFNNTHALAFSKFVLSPTFNVELSWILQSRTVSANRNVQKEKQSKNICHCSQTNPFSFRLFVSGFSDGTKGTGISRNDIFITFWIRRWHATILCKSTPTLISPTESLSINRLPSWGWKNQSKSN